MCCLPKGFDSHLNSQSNSSFGIYSKALKQIFIVLGSKVSYKLGCFLNSRLKFIKSFLANETLI